MDVMRTPLSVLDAPSNLGLRPPREGQEPGVRRMAAALRATDLLARLGAEDAGEVPPPRYSPDLDPVVRIRNASAIRDYSRALAGRLGALLDAGRFPLVLGGDCSILLGTMLALRKRGRYGLVYVDGHTDFATPETSPSGGAAGMDLALVAGQGPDALADLEGFGPLVREEDIVLLGHRDMDHPDRYGARVIFGTAIRRHDLGAVRRAGMALIAAAALATLRARNLDGFWIHVDVDVLDSTLMPAVDSPQPDGLSYEELHQLLAPLLMSDLATGIQFTIFDPDLDPEGRYAQGARASHRERTRPSLSFPGLPR
jgi:arginase